MKAMMCSIFDITVSTYRQPFYAMNEEDAKRAFNMILNSNELMKNNPSDFELYVMGTFDDQDGITGERNKIDVGYVLKPVRLFKGGEIFNEYKANQNNTI